jgi:hypothetical protein
MLRFVLFGLGMLLGQSAGVAQEPSPAPDATVEAGDGDADLKLSPRPRLGSVPKLLQDMQGNVGFAVGMYGSYASPARTASGQRSPGQTSSWINPMLFADFRKNRSEIYMAYNFAYRSYSARTQPNNDAHSVTVELQRAVTRRLSLDVTEIFTSASNDHAILHKTPATDYFDQSIVQALDVPVQRVNRSSLMGSLRFRMTRRNTLSGFISHELSRYGKLEFGNTQVITAGLRSSYQVNRWLVLDNSYSHTLNAADKRPPGNGGQIHRFQIGGLRFLRTRRGWEGSLSGGAEMNSGGERLRPMPSIQTAVSKTWTSGQFQVQYHRGFWVAIGPGAVVQGQSVTASIGQALGRRTNLSLSSTYDRGTGNSGSPISYASSNAQIEIPLQRHVLWTASYWYTWQQLETLPLEVRSSRRYSVNLSMQYFLPPLDRKAKQQ